MDESKISFHKHLFTGKDNKSFDVIRFLLYIIVLSGILLTSYVVFKNCNSNSQSCAFDLISYGSGMGGLLVTAGAALKLKADTEPEPPKDISDEKPTGQ